MLNVESINNSVSIASFRANDRQQYKYSQQPIVFDYDQLQADKFQKKKKNNNIKNNIITGVSLASGLAIIALVLMQIRAMKGGISPDGFKLSNLEFKNLTDDKSVFDLVNTKSLHPKVKKFFIGTNILIILFL